MFVSLESNSKHINKKALQKPNILRKSPKTSKESNIIECIEAKVVKSMLPSQELQDLSVDKNSKHKCSKPCHIMKKAASRIKLDTYISEEYRTKMLQNVNSTDSKSNVKNIKLDNLKTHVEDHDNSNNNNENIESPFIMDLILNNDSSQRSVDNIQQLNGMLKSNLTGSNWCYIPVNDISPKHENYPDMDMEINWSNFSIPLSEEFLLSNVSETTDLSQQDAIINASVPLSDVLATGDIVYKCDVSACSKVFPTEQKLKKHKGTHNKNNSSKILRQSIECPVKKSGHDQNEACGRLFNIRDNLLHHLKEDHTPEEAPYSCDVCGRHFFWLSGLRAHSRAHASAGGGRREYACTWPGCHRVFPQACRLKEHSRAHTGDKPYACRHPNCGWSFRTASKLLRHGRRHTGDRRHRCGVCGRAFLRAEHLREHAARHARPSLPCRVPDCDQTFANRSSLCLHMKKVHKKDQKKKRVKSGPIYKDLESDWSMVDNMFMVSDLETSGLMCEQMEHVEHVEHAEHAARTHCTWPLGERARDHVGTVDVLEGDVPVELSEGSESNIFTVRSDLFLHGNVLNNDDSNGGEEGVSGEAGGELVLLQHTSTMDDLLPATDLMQEELMYTDTAVDESSFQVLLLSEDDEHNI